MNRAEALRSIEDDLVEYIQQKVFVDFDNFRQIPVEFRLNGKRHCIRESLGRFRTRLECHINGYLVKTMEGEVYFIYFDWTDASQPRAPIQKGVWVLSFRILHDNELMTLYREYRKLLMNMTLKRVVDFHGHLCPEIVVGAKLCEYIFTFLSKRSDQKVSLAIVAENCTPAIDAIQVQLGTTLGNQRLLLIDYSKHNYTVMPNEGLRFSLRPQRYGDEDEYEALELEEKIRTDRVTLEEVVRFQTLLDNRVKHLMERDPEELFETEPVAAFDPPCELAIRYVSCRNCGQPVLKSRAVETDAGLNCLPCFQRTHARPISLNFNDISHLKGESHHGKYSQTDDLGIHIPFCPSTSKTRLPQLSRVGLMWPGRVLTRP